jgi:hypothetical protein
MQGPGADNKTERFSFANSTAGGGISAQRQPVINNRRQAELITTKILS